MGMKRGNYRVLSEPAVIGPTKVSPVRAALAAVVALAALAGLLAPVTSAAPSLRSWPAPGELAWTPIGPGVHYAVASVAADGWLQHIQVVRVERDNPFVSLAATLGRGQVEGTETVLAQARQLTADGLAGAATARTEATRAATSGTAVSGSPLSDLLSRLSKGGTEASPVRTVVAGVNADFFASAPTAGLPVGLHVQAGEIVTSPNGRPAFALLADGRVVIGVPELSGAVWREEAAEALAGGQLSSLEEMPARAAITQVNRPLNGLGLVLYTPRFGPETPPLTGTVVTVRGVPGPLVGGRTYTGVVAKVQAAAGTPGLRVPIPADGVVLAGRGPEEVLLEDLRVGEWVQFRVDLAPPFDQAVEAVAGWPVLIENGSPRPLPGGDSLVTGRHPRTAVGFNDQYLYLVTVDGRQPGWSDGMTLAELTELLLALGATQALNLDGGGSTTLVVRPPGEAELVVANRPSDGYERVVANALFVVSTAPPGPLATLHIRPAAPAALAGSALPLKLLGQDRYNNPVAVAAADAEWTVRGEAEVRLDSAAGVHAALLLVREPGEVVVTARVGGVEAEVVVDVVHAVHRIDLAPDVMHLAAGERSAFSVRAYDEAGRPVWVEPRQLTWTAAADGAAGDESPPVVLVDEGGGVAGLRGGTATVSARLGAVAGNALVTVDREPVVLSDFEAPGLWYANAVRAQAAFDLVEAPEPVYEGQRAGRLVYDLSVSGGGTAAAYVQAATPIPIPDRPRAIGVWVYGDASGHWLRAHYIDGNGQRQVLDLTRVGGLDWTGWRFVQAEIPADAVLPLAFERVYVVEMHRERQSRGVLYFDNLVAIYGQP